MLRKASPKILIPFHHCFCSLSPFMNNANTFYKNYMLLNIYY